MAGRVPTYMIAMAVVTGLYLTVEIPFSIHLVRILGGFATEADIDAIEKFGRLLTGVAVALAYVGIRTYPRYHLAGCTFWEATRAAVFRAIPLIALVYFGLHFYGEARGSFSTGDMRKEAFISNLAKRTLAEDGINGNPASADPSWLATVSGMSAILPADRLVDLTGLSLDELARREALRTVGEPEAARTAFSAEIESQLSKAYGEFLSASYEAERAVADSDSIADGKWADYRRRLGRHFGDRLPRPGTGNHSRVIKELRSEGLKVSGSFRLDDRKGFYAAVRQKVREEAAQAFVRGIELHIGKGSRLFPGAEEDKFYSDPAVQRKIREELSGLKVSPKVLITPDMSASAFSSSVYPQLLERATNRVLGMARGSAYDFVSYYGNDTGEAAMKAATLPSTALLLSLAGALFHIHKFSGYLILIVGNAAGSRLLSSKAAKHAFALTALALAVFAMRPGIPAHLGEVIEEPATVYGKMVAGAISLQPGMFFIGEAMASNGPWQFIDARLPQPRLPGNVSATGTASADAVMAVPEPRPEVVAEAELTNIPIPLPRPR